MLCYSVLIKRPMTHKHAKFGNLHSIVHAETEFLSREN